MELSVIIPVYNEQERLAETLSETAQALQGMENHEILLIDDGSTDESIQIMEGFCENHSQARLIRHERNLGKGDAVQTGIKQAQFPVCLFLDADGSTTMNEWPAFEQEFNKGAEVVIASRRLKDSVIDVPQPFSRRFLGGGYRFMCRIIFGLQISDFNCGYKAYKTDIAKRVYSEVQMKDWTFDVEIFLLLKKYGHSVTELPVHWAHRKKVSNLPPFKTAVRTLMSLWTLFRRYR